MTLVEEIQSLIEADFADADFEALLLEFLGDIKKQAVVMMGLPAAGKSTFIKREAQKYIPGFKGYSSVNSDVQLARLQYDLAREHYDRLSQAKSRKEFDLLKHGFAYKTGMNSIKLLPWEWEEWRSRMSLLNPQLVLRKQEINRKIQKRAQALIGRTTKDGAYVDYLRAIIANKPEDAKTLMDPKSDSYNDAEEAHQDLWGKPDKRMGFNEYWKAAYKPFYATYFDIRMLAKKYDKALFQDKVIKSGNLFIIDTVAAKPASIFARLTKTKAQGFQNTIIYLEIDAEFAIARDAYRGSSEGRTVGPEVIMGYASNMERAFKTYKAEGAKPDGIVDRLLHFTWSGNEIPSSGTWVNKADFRYDLERKKKSKKAARATG